jgi:hypothetical protein
MKVFEGMTKLDVRPTPILERMIEVSERPNKKRGPVNPMASLLKIK